jgi:NAD-dependent dihydropyrimidine dehydrogenase PreA subunit
MSDGVIRSTRSGSTVPPSVRLSVPAAARHAEKQSGYAGCTCRSGHRNTRNRCQIPRARHRQEDVLVTYTIAQPCVDLKDLACVEECPVDCIYEGERMLYIHPDECVDCGACEPVCPVEAIFYEDDVPEQWKEYTQANAEFFDDLGSPGGASKLGLIDKDHQLIAALPPQENGEH